MSWREIGEFARSLVVFTVIGTVCRLLLEPQGFWERFALLPLIFFFFWGVEETEDEDEDGGRDKLAAAIRKHRDACGHDRCWLNDMELYAALGEPTPTSMGMPPREEFLARCAEYHEQQTRPVTGAEALRRLL